MKPIISISGDHELNQVFFDDVRVPVSSLLGEENDGWTVAKYLLQHERGHSYAPSLQMKLERLKKMTRQECSDKGGALADDSAFSAKIADLEIALQGLEFLELRLFSEAGQGKPIGALSSMVKVRGTELRQKVTEIGIELIAYYGSPLQFETRQFRSAVGFVGPEYGLAILPQYLNDRAASIYAGSNEVQRNIMAKAILGL